MNDVPARAAALAAAVLALAGCAPVPAPPEPVRAVRTVTVDGEAAGQTREYAADVRARTEARLGFRVAGKLVERPAEVGRAVRAGQVLAQLDGDDLRLSQDAARAAVDAARVQHDLAKAELERFKELRRQGFISGAELERREATWRAASAQLDQARAQAGVQRNQAAYSVLTAPVAGVVTAVEAEPGAVVAAGVPVLRLAFDGPRDVVFAVPEDEVDALRRLLGRPGGVAVRLWTGGEALAGTVREVAAAADPATRTFLVKAGVASDRLRLGQTATVLIEQPRTPGVARLPLTAVAERSGRSAVWIVDRATMTVRSRPVEVAAADGSDVVVTSGVGAGEVVVTAGVHVLADGQKVRLLPPAAGGPERPFDAAAPAVATAR